MKIKLIAADLDGTLLDDAKQLPEKNLCALSQCAEKGIEVVPATGRTLSGLPKELKSLPGVHFAILMNGALVADLRNNHILDACRLPYSLAVQVMELARFSQDDIMYDAYVDGIGYTTHYFYEHVEKYVESPGVAKLVRTTRTAVPDHIAFIAEQGHEVDKINMFFTEEHIREKMRKQLAQIPGLLVSSSLKNNLEINAAGADKGGALLRLAGHLGIAREETMAFGDGENDVSLLRSAGIGISMKNGVPAVKAAADQVTTLDNNESGVAETIRQLVLNGT